MYPLYYSHVPHTAWRLHDSNLTHRWDIVQQTTDSLKILKKSFSDPDLPKSLLMYKKASYVYNQKKILWHINKLLANGEVKTAGNLLKILSNEGCWEDSACG
jgi:hypothetical protein